MGEYISGGAVMMLLACFFWAADADAQGPYSSLSVGVNVGYSLSGTDFERSWDVGPSALLNVSVPFHVGRIEAGAMAFRNAGILSSANDFSAGFFFAGWGPVLRLLPRLQWRTSGLAGDLLMLFDQGTSGFSKRENELVLGAKSTLVLELPANLEIEGGLVAFRVYTATPIDLVFVSTGLRYRLNISPRLQKLLQ